MPMFGLLHVALPVFMSTQCNVASGSLNGPGILPVTNLAQIQRITSLCKARLPTSFVAALEQAGDSDDEQFEVGVEFATRQVRELLDSDVLGVHFYVLNKSPAAVRVLQSVGWRVPTL